jgi:hypothetical protein
VGVYDLVARHRAEGEAAFEPRSRRPKRSPRALPSSTVELIVALRRRLAGEGLDAGADTIRWHLEHHHRLVVSRAYGAAMVVESTGASAVLLFAMPHRQPSQPWAVIGGRLLSAVIGVTAGRFVASIELARRSPSVPRSGDAPPEVHPSPRAARRRSRRSSVGATVHALGYGFVVRPVLLIRS